MIDYEILYHQHYSSPKEWKVATTLGKVKARTEKEAEYKMKRKVSNLGMNSISFALRKVCE